MSQLKVEFKNAFSAVLGTHYIDVDPSDEERVEFLTGQLMDRYPDAVQAEITDPEGNSL